MENLVTTSPEGVRPYFYRTSGGAEIDLLLAWQDQSLWAIEVKRSLSPKLERGFHSACVDLSPARRFVVYPGTERYPMASGTEAISLPALMHELAQAHSGSAWKY